PQTAEGGTLRLAYLADMAQADPDVFYDIEGNTVILSVYEGLLKYQPDSTEIIPSLAETWEVSPDGLTYTFHLRTGVKFHDGTPFTAQQVLSSFRRALDPATKGGRGWPLYPIVGAKDYADGKAKSVSGLIAPNDSTVVVRLSEPCA